MLKKTEVEQFRKQLIEIRARIRGDVQHLTDGAFEGGDSSKSPTHMAELGTEAYEQDFSLRVAESDQETLDAINEALERIENGTFGLCEGCVAEGKTGTKASIPKMRLKVLPYARNCVECERKRENAWG